MCQLPTIKIKKTTEKDFGVLIKKGLSKNVFKKEELEEKPV